MTKTAVTLKAVVDDGRGTAQIWEVTHRRSGRIEWGEFQGYVVGVHTEEEALEAWRVQEAGG